MKKTTISGAILLLCLFSPLICKITGEDKAGVDFLRINLNARPAAMGGAFIAVADDSNAINWNPAGLAFMKEHEINFTYISWFTAITAGNIIYAGPVKENLFCGINLLYMDYGKTQGYDNNNQPISEFSSYGILGTCSMGMKLTGNSSMGINLKYIRENIESESGAATAFDAGGLIYLSQKLSLGLAVKNIGTKMKFIQREDFLPSSFGLGIAYRLLKNNDLLLTADVNQYSDTGIALQVGSEIRLLNKFALRIGYKAVREVPNNMSIGIGFYIKNYVLDYAFVPYDDLGSTNRVSCTIKFGTAVKMKSENRDIISELDNVIKSEEKMPVKTETKEEKDIKMRLHFSKGTEFYKSGKYKEAIIEWEEVLKINPDHKITKEKIRKARENILSNQKNK